MRTRDGAVLGRRGNAPVPVGVLWLCLCLGLVFGPLANATAVAQEGPPAAGPAVVAAGGETVLLREAPGYDAGVVTTLAEGGALEVLGGPVAAPDGSSWLQVSAAGQVGYVPAGYVAGAPAGAPPPSSEPPAAAAPVDPVAAPPPDGPAPPVAAPAPGAATTTTDANLRSGPSYDAGVLTVLPAGTAVSVDGAPDGGFVPVTANGASGWIAAELLAEGGAPADPGAAPAPPALPPPAPDPSTPFAATVNADTPILAAPDSASAVLGTVPAGSAIRTTGGPENGYFPVDYAGTLGWVQGTNLSLSGGQQTSITPATIAVSTPVPTPVPTAAPEPAAAPATAEPAAEEFGRGSTSTNIAWPFVGGEWEVIQGYNNGTHTNRSSFAQYQYSLDWARVDGQSAGQPVYAPVSGLIQWIDRGSGGMLVDAGNGYGVAVFHVTYNGGLSRGGSVRQGERIGTVSGPGGDGYMSVDHVEIAAWRLLEGGGHESVPFVGPNAIGGREFPDSGGGNQHMGARVSP